jgi:hypothetical protein
VVARARCDVKEGEEVRWTGFFATGGEAFLGVELLVEVERRRSAGFGGGVGLLVEGGTSFREICDKFLSSAVTEGEGLKGGGSLRSPLVAAEVDRFEFA